MFKSVLSPLSLGVEALVRLRLELSDDVLESGREFAKLCNGPKVSQKRQGKVIGRKEASQTTYGLQQQYL